MSEPDWLKVVPAHLVPPVLREDLRAAAAAAARRSEVAERVAELADALSVGAGDETVAPALLYDTALRLGVWRSVEAVLPQAPVVDPSRYEAIYLAWVASWPPLDAGLPPQYVADVVHHAVYHPDAPVPRPLPGELEAVDQFATLCSFQGLGMFASIADVGKRIAAVAEFEASGGVQRRVNHVAAIRAHVDELDAHRRARWDFHRCAAAPEGAPPLPAGGPGWSFDIAAITRSLGLDYRLGQIHDDRPAAAAAGARPAASRDLGGVVRATVRGGHFR